MLASVLHLGDTSISLPEKFGGSRSPTYWPSSCLHEAMRTDILQGFAFGFYVPESDRAGLSRVHPRRDEGTRENEGEEELKANGVEPEATRIGTPAQGVSNSTNQESLKTWEDSCEALTSKTWNSGKRPQSGAVFLVRELPSKARGEIAFGMQWRRRRACESCPGLAESKNDLSKYS